MERKSVRHMVRLEGIVLVILLVHGRLAMAFQSPDSLSLRGKPQIVHYTKDQINSNSQFWSMAQAADGILYYGNNDGALIFDGEQWQKVRLPNNSSVRAIAIGSDGVVYAGGYNEFGKIRKDPFGKYYYESMTGLLRPEDKNFENAWQIHEVQGRIVFRTRRLLIAVAENKAITLPAENRFVYSMSSAENSL
jgi:AraC family transcriptional regulator, chitin signaling transcriptional activator